MKLEDVARVQGAVWLLSGLWPIVHLRSFEAITGPKPEGWLVKTVGSLIAVQGATLLLAARRRRITRELATGSALAAVALAAVDVWYAGARRRISPVYLLDAILEGGLAAGWLLAERGSPAGASDRIGEHPAP